MCLFAQCADCTGADSELVQLRLWVNSSETLVLPVTLYDLLHRQQRCDCGDAMALNLICALKKSCITLSLLFAIVVKVSLTLFREDQQYG